MLSLSTFSFYHTLSKIYCTSKSNCHNLCSFNSSDTRVKRQKQNSSYDSGNSSDNEIGNSSDSETGNSSGNESGNSSGNESGNANIFDFIGKTLQNEK